jgi:uncharacterized protein YjiS (DUF1127 family)
MNIRTARDDASLLFPANMSYGAAEPVAQAAGQADLGRKAARFGDRVRQALAWIAELPRRHAVLAQLETMSDRELADIGLVRGELSKVFSAGYAATRGRV